MTAARPHAEREAGRLRCPECGGRPGVPCAACDGRRVLVVYQCPACEGATPGPGRPNACEVCLGQREVNLEILDVYLREGLEGYRRWMRRRMFGPE